MSQHQENSLARGIVAENVPSPWRRRSGAQNVRDHSRKSRWANSTAVNPCHLPSMSVPSTMHYREVRGALEREGTFRSGYKFPLVYAPLMNEWALTEDAASKMTMNNYHAFVIARDNALNKNKNCEPEYTSNRYGRSRQRTPPLALRRNTLVGYARKRKRTVRLVRKTLKQHLQYTRRSILKKAVPSTRIYNRVPSKRLNRKKRTSYAPESMDSDSRYSSAIVSLPSTLSSDGQDIPEDIINYDPVHAEPSQPEVIELSGPISAQQQPTPSPNPEPQDIYGIPVMPLEPNSDAMFDPLSKQFVNDHVPIDSHQPGQTN